MPDADAARVPPPSAKTTSYSHRVSFYETDAMGIVHHSNYLRFFEEARVAWLEDHDRPYAYYMGLDLHLAVTRAEAEYVRGARFGEMLDVITWLVWVRGASLAMAYRVECDGELLATGLTEHAVVNGAGRPQRLPKETREKLRQACGDPES